MIKISKKKFVLMIVGVVIATLIAGATGVFVFTNYNDVVLVSKTNYTQMKKISEKYSKLYQIQTAINEKSIWDVDEETQMNTLYKSLVGTLGDKYSEYMTPAEAKEWESYLSGSFSGVGINFTQDEKGNFVVLKIIDGSPAASSDIKAGDYIVSVDGKTYSDQNKLAEAIRGDEGTKVTIKYTRDGKSKEVKLTRAVVKEQSVYSTTVGDNMGYIRITAFEEGTATQFKKELSSLENKNVKGIIIDIRDNGGGYTQEGIDIADMLLPEGTITYMEDKNGKKTNYNSDESCTKQKYVLLVNENTASTSEILAAAVKDNKGGSIVGKTTYGKGIVQGTYSFEDGSALKLTIMQYFSPKGNKIHKVGVKPDYEVELATEDTVDKQLNKAMELLSN